jgi:hypothetical protein
MADIAVQSASANQITFTDASATGDTFNNGQSPLLVIRNKNAASRVITIDAPGTCNFGLSANPAHDTPLTILGDAGTGSYLFLRPDPVHYNDINNSVAMTYSNNGNGLSIAVVI